MRCVIITGPTASGKSKLAYTLAREHNGIVINADSMQWYKDLSILTAQPSAEEMSDVPHFLYGALDVYDDGSVAKWQSIVLSLLNKYTDRLCVVVGGSGLYLRSLTHGLSCVPHIPDDIRTHARTLAADMELTRFRDYVYQIDPEILTGTPPTDTQRLTRALEVKLATGQSIRYYQGHAQPPVTRPCLYNALLIEKDLLNMRIEKRAENMFSDASLSQVAEFWEKQPAQDCLLKKAIGLDAVTQYMRGNLSRVQALDLLIIQTRQYAKRQRTWINGQSPEYVAYNLSLHDMNIAVADCEN